MGPCICHLPFAGLYPPKCAVHGYPRPPICMNGDVSKFTRVKIEGLPPDWMRVAPGTDAAIWRPWSRETGEL